MVSSVAWPAPPLTRLPTVTILLLTRPSIGEVTWHHSRFSRDNSTAAFAPASTAAGLIAHGLGVVVVLLRDRVALQCLGLAIEVQLRDRKLRLGFC